MSFYLLSRALRSTKVFNFHEVRFISFYSWLAGFSSSRKVLLNFTSPRFIFSIILFKKLKIFSFIVSSLVNVKISAVYSVRKSAKVHLFAHKCKFIAKSLFIHWFILALLFQFHVLYGGGIISEIHNLSHRSLCPFIEISPS